MTAPAPPPPSAGRRMAVTLLAALPWPAVLFQFVTVLGGYDKLFRQFNVPVNDVVAILLNVSAWTRRHLEAAFGIAFVLMVVSMVAAHTTFLAPMSRRRR